MLRLVLRKEAERDVLEAFNWYDKKVPGLGTAFLAAVEWTLEAISANPAIPACSQGHPSGTVT